MTNAITFSAIFVYWSTVGDCWVATASNIWPPTRESVCYVGDNRVRLLLRLLARFPSAALYRLPVNGGGQAERGWL